MPIKKSKPKKEPKVNSLLNEQKNSAPVDFNHNEIEKALFERAKGFEYYEIIFEPGEKEEEERIIKRTKKTIIP